MVLFKITLKNILRVLNSVNMKKKIQHSIEFNPKIVGFILK